MTARRRLSLGALILGAWLLAVGSASGATDAPKVTVLTATGTVDQVLAGYIAEGIEAAARDGADAVLIELNTPGGSLDATNKIVSTILEAPLPVIVWVAPAGGYAASAGTFITLASNVALMAPGTRIGAASPVGSGGEDIEGTLGDKVLNDAIASISSIAETRGRNVEWAASTVRDAKSSPVGAGVGVRIAETATSVDGVPMLASVSFTFKVRTALGESGSAPLAAGRSSSPADASERQAEERRADEAAKAAAKREKAARAAAAKAANAAKAAREKAARAAARAKAAAEKAASRQREKPAEPRARPKPSAGGSSWIAVEAYYLVLINCTRTGGWVQKNGKCKGAGSRKVAPLKLDAGISANVARPYAKKLALAGACTHFSGGGPSARLRRAGFSSQRWAENLSCPPGMTPSQTAVYSIRYFQNEKPWNRGHYRNLMNPAYDRVGIGIWAANGRVIIVSDFYRP
ncbi:MAG: hypothetical protein FJ038_11050 [Chloroflexi bacterium]|nr:hypothetical protein [Chloroflexota bacterium]